MASSLSTYLRRIGYTGPIEPTKEVLFKVHRAHLLSIPYENLDIHLGRALSLDIDAIFDKIVNRKRGGWCYEMNGLLAWALREIGFDVTLLGGTVGRERMGNLAEGNHLVLLVKLDQPYIADAGFGNAFLEPLPLVEGEHVQQGFVFRLERTPPPASHGDVPPPRAGREGLGVRWFFHNHQQGGPGFDFTLQPYDIGDFAAQCRWLQTSPESGFVRVTVCHHFTPTGIVSLRGAVLQHITVDGIAESVIASEGDYARVLQDNFALDLGDDLHRLWLIVHASHLAWVESQRT